MPSFSAISATVPPLPLHFFTGGGPSCSWNTSAICRRRSSFSEEWLHRDGAIARVPVAGSAYAERRRSACGAWSRALARPPAVNSRVCLALSAHLASRPRLAACFFFLLALPRAPVPRVRGETELPRLSTH